MGIFNFKRFSSSTSSPSKIIPSNSESLKSASKESQEEDTFFMSNSTVSATSSNASIASSSTTLLQQPGNECEEPQHGIKDAYNIIEDLCANGDEGFYAGIPLMGSVTVTGISSTCSSSDLVKFFSFCGDIEQIKIRTNRKEEGEGNEEEEEEEEQEAIITFESSDAVDTALDLTGSILNDKRITVNSYTPSVIHHRRSSLLSARSMDEFLTPDEDSEEEEEEDQQRQNKIPSTVISKDAVRAVAEYLAAGYLTVEKLDGHYHVSQIAADALDYACNLDNHYKITKYGLDVSQGRIQ